MQNTLAKKISIIVSSSDGYDDCWEPFFTLLKNYFPGIEQIEILLSTQTKDYYNPDFKLKVVKHGMKAAWSKRLRQTLEQSSNEIILFLDDDSFIRSSANIKRLTELVELMASNDKIAHIRLTKGDWDTTPTKEFEIIEELTPGSKKRFMMHAGFWKKDILIKHLSDHESTWEVETWGDFRANIMNYDLYCVSKNIIRKEESPYNTSSNGGIYKGKWIESYVVSLFKENKIQVDYSKRGFNKSKDRLFSRIQIHLHPLFHPISTVRSISNLIFLKLSWKGSDSSKKNLTINA